MEQRNNRENGATGRFKTSARADMGGRRKYGEDKRAASKRKKEHSLRRRLLMALFTLVITTLAVLLVYKFLFRISEVEIIGSASYTEDEILSAAGIGYGTNLFSFRSSTVKDGIKSGCPFIADVETERKIPNKLTLTLTETNGAYGAYIYGDRVLLDSALKVLAVDSGERALPEGTVKLILPDVKRAVEGETLVFADELEGSVALDILSAIENSSLNAIVTKIDLTDVYSAAAYCPAKSCCLRFGSPDRIGNEIETAEKILEDEMFSDGTKRIVNLRTEGKTGIYPSDTFEFD